MYKEDRHPTDVLRHPEWRQYPGEADPDMACHDLAKQLSHYLYFLFFFFFFSHWDLQLQGGAWESIT